MNLFKNWIATFEVASRAKTLYQLRALPENQLIHAGISPELLLEGVQAWPWRHDDNTDATALKGVAAGSHSATDSNFALRAVDATIESEENTAPHAYDTAA